MRLIALTCLLLTFGGRPARAATTRDAMPAASRQYHADAASRPRDRARP